MRRCLRTAAGLLPHLLAVGALMLLTVYLINRVNPAMSFLDSESSQVFELLFAAVSLLNAAAVCRLHGKRRRLCAAAAALTVLNAVWAATVLLACCTGNRSLLTAPLFEGLCLCCAVFHLVFAAAVIAVNRRRKK